MGTAIVLIVLAAIIVGCVISSKKHFSGEGDCCGGGSEVKIKGDKLESVVAEKTIDIEGMHCKNCSSHVQSALNGLGQVNARVNLKKGQAVVKMGRQISDDELRACVEKAGYTVKKIA